MMRSDDHHHLDKNTRLWGEFLNRLQGLRNEIMHQGMKLESVKCCLPKEVAVFWNRIKDAQTPPPRIGGGSGRLLITPQGLAAGVLFSAIAHTRPHTALVVCSAESKASVGDACHASGFAVSAELCEVADPQSGFNELETLVKRWRPILLRADEIVANLTGGTTFLGLAVPASQPKKPNAGWTGQCGGSPWWIGAAHKNNVNSPLSRPKFTGLTDSHRRNLPLCRAQYPKMSWFQIFM